MDILTLTAIAIGLGMDAFAVSLCVASSPGGLSPRAKFRLPFHFGFFQFSMPILGWFLGSSISSYIHDVDHWIAFALLAFIGAKMIKESRGTPHDIAEATDPTRGMMLVALSIATSIDALAVGLSMSFLGVSVWMPSVAIGVVAAAMTLTGMHIGCRMGRRFGKKMEFIGGVILILIGVKIVIEHTL